MRSFGSRRGNCAVRFMVEQTARRRLWTALTPEQRRPEDGSTDPLAERWTRNFFERLRDVVLPRMARVERLEVGELRHFGSAALSLWALAGPRGLVFAYEHEETPDSVRERALRWNRCLATRTAPGLASRHWGHPVYGARVEPASDDLDVLWAEPGDWMALAHAGGAAPMPGDETSPGDHRGFERS